MIIGGLQKFSLIDYPDKIGAVVFTQGCNFVCGYCHNPELVLPEKFSKPISEKEILEFLKKRIGKLEAVTITGGEPTIQVGLTNFIKKIKEMGFLVKLDTNGTNPKLLKEILDKNLVDYVAMDIKAPLLKYPEIINKNVDIKKIEESIKLIMKEKNINYEFRTTILKSQLTFNDFEKIGELICGAELYALQKFVPTKANNPNFLTEKTYSDKEFKELEKILNKYVKKCITR